MKIIVQFSGGKDSQACLIWAVKKYGKEKVTALFCDTGWEHPITYKHVTDICSVMGVELIVLKSDKYSSFQDMCKKQKYFPSGLRRTCTSWMKVFPMVDWILKQDESMIIIQGIRAKESQKRSMMAEECSYFGDYFGEKAKNLYQKQKVREWCKTHDASVLRPVFGWTAQEVIDYILENGQQPNELYKRGASRVGCFPCVMSRLSEVKQMMKDEAMRERLVNLEKEVSEAKGEFVGFFGKGYIPERFCKNGKGIPTVDEVIAYVNRNDLKVNLFQQEEDETSCMSLFHGLCE